MKNKKTGMILRIILYAIIIVALIILRYTNILNFGCYIYNTTGIQGPTCGFTRALLAILDLDILSAVKYNSFFTLVFFPVFLFLSIQDIIYISINFIKDKNYKSYVEIIFGE